MAPGREHRFLDALQDAHGSAAGLARDRYRKRLDFEIRFTAVRSADERHVDLHLGVGQPEHVGNLGTHQKRMRGRAPQRNDAGDHTRNRTVSLHRVLVDHWKGESLFDNLFRGGKSFVWISLDEILTVADIPAEAFTNARHLVKFSRA